MFSGFHSFFLAFIVVAIAGSVGAKLVQRVHSLWACNFFGLGISIPSC